MNLFLAAAPHAQIAHGRLGCEVNIDDLADRPARPLDSGDVIDIGAPIGSATSYQHHPWSDRLLRALVLDRLTCRPDCVGLRLPSPPKGWLVARATCLRHVGGDPFRAWTVACRGDD